MSHCPCIRSDVRKELLQNMLGGALTFLLCAAGKLAIAWPHHFASPCCCCELLMCQGGEISSSRFEVVQSKEMRSCDFQKCSTNLDGQFLDLADPSEVKWHNETAASWPHGTSMAARRLWQPFTSNDIQFYCAIWHQKKFLFSKQFSQVLKLQLLKSSRSLPSKF